MTIKIKAIRLRKPEERKEQCYFCDGKKSVKYYAKFDDAGEEKIVPCCNSCAYKYFAGMD